nr:protein IQ-DOMAIN 1-like [Ipomoea batatas]
MLEENRALQRQLLQKHAKELKSLRRGDGWDDSIQSKEQIEASLLSKYEAAMRRERALAYSYSHQQTWNKSSRSSNLLFMDPTNVNTNGETNSTSGVLASAIVAVLEAGEKSDGERRWLNATGGGRRRSPASGREAMAGGGKSFAEALAAVQDDGELPSPLMQRRRLGVWLEATAMVTQRAMARLQRPWQQLHEPAAAMNRTTTGTRPPLFSASIAAAMVELFLSSMATGVQRWPPSPISLHVQALPPPHPGNPSHPNKHIFSCTSPATIGKLTIPATSSNFHGFRV